MVDNDDDDVDCNYDDVDDDDDDDDDGRLCSTNINKTWLVFNKMNKFVVFADKIHFEFFF